MLWLIEESWLNEKAKKEVKRWKEAWKRIMRVQESGVPWKKTVAA